MVLVAMEQSEPPGRRLVDDDLAARFLPAPTRWLVTATPPTLMRRLTMAAMEREGPGLWASMTCRKRYIADKVTEALDDIDAVVVLGAGFDTLAYRLAQKDSASRSSRSTNPSTSTARAAAVRRALGEQPSSVRLVPLDFEHDDVLTVLAEHGYRPDNRTFFIWEAVTQYLTAEAVHATLERLRRRRREADWCSPMSEGISSTASTSTVPTRCTAGSGERQQLWQFGMPPEEVAAFLAGHGWRLAEQARTRADHAALRRADRSPSHRVADRVVGVMQRRSS